MNYMERKRMFDNICNFYSRNIWIHVGDCGADGRAFSYVIRREIVLPESAFRNPSEWDILALLHEIGHIKTNTQKMKVYEKEYYATQWAANEAKRIGFYVSPEWKKAYQEYIFEKRQNCINRKGKNVVDKNKLIIKW